MSTRPLDPQRPDKDNPEWTPADMAKARPAPEVLRGLIGARATNELLRRGKGRPPKQDRKVNQTIRIDPDVLEAYRQEGKGWQTHINEVLRQNMPKHTNRFGRRLAMNTPTPICAQCGGTLEHKIITHQQPWGGELYEFENVPALVCRQCGEVYMTAKVTQLMDAVIREQPQPKRYHQVPVFSLPEFSA